MKTIFKLALVRTPIAILAACGGSDVADRLDLADPAVRFVNASQTPGNLTLNSAGVARGDATNTPYPFASNYDFGISTSATDWTITTAPGNLPVGTRVNIDPQRGTRYTLVAMDSAPGVTNLYRTVSYCGSSTCSGNIRQRSDTTRRASRCPGMWRGS